MFPLEVYPLQQPHSNVLRPPLRSLDLGLHSDQWEVASVVLQRQLDALHHRRRRAVPLDALGLPALPLQSLAQLRGLVE